MRGKNRIIN